MIPLIQKHHEFTVPAAEGPALIEVTATARAWIGAMPARDGLLTVFLRHTSGSLMIQESALPNMRADLLVALARLAPESSAYGHGNGGQDDMPGHVRAMLASVSLAIPVFGGTMAVGPGQGIYLIEHRKRSTPRPVLLHYVGSRG